jgi:hypothetical protein
VACVDGLIQDRKGLIGLDLEVPLGVGYGAHEHNQLVIRYDDYTAITSSGVSKNELKMCELCNSLS